MRTFLHKWKQGIGLLKLPVYPARVVKVFGGYMCFESDNDYRVWKIKVNNYDRNINTIRLPILVYTGN